MLDFIYYANAGGGKGAQAMKSIALELSKRDIPFRSFETKAEKHAIALAKNLSENGSTDIIAVGGDGTINEVLNGIDVEKINFGIIPAGSGNDFIHSCNIPCNALEALEVILTSSPKPTDYLDCSGVRGINIIGAGLDVEILERCRKSKFLKGKLQYLVSLIISLMKFKTYEFDTIVKGERQSKDATIVCVGNGRMLGGGIKMCPEASIEDGLMDFVICKGMKKSKLFGALTKLLKGKILEQPFTEFSRETEVEVCFDKKTTINIDGELYYDLPFLVKIVPNGVKLYRP